MGKWDDYALVIKELKSDLYESWDRTEWYNSYDEEITREFARTLCLLDDLDPDAAVEENADQDVSLATERPSLTMTDKYVKKAGLLRQAIDNLIAVRNP